VPVLIAVNKADLPEARKGASALRRALARRKGGSKEVYLVSAVTGEGLDELLDAVAGVLYETKARERGGLGKRLGKRRAAK